jgi:septum site-determining protein MinC
MLGGMPDFFNGEAVILDFAAVAQMPSRIDWPGLQSLLRRYRLQPIGVMRLAPNTTRAPGAPGSRSSIRRSSPPAARRGARAPARAPEPVPTPRPPLQHRPRARPAATPTMFVDRPLRSGQQIYARGTDLVLLGGVSPGAEVIADGSIHCYGPCAGARSRAPRATRRRASWPATSAPNSYRSPACTAPSSAAFPKPLPASPPWCGSPAPTIHSTSKR